MAIVFRDKLQKLEQMMLAKAFQLAEYQARASAQCVHATGSKVKVVKILSTVLRIVVKGKGIVLVNERLFGKLYS